jgi:hypothetical protein
MEPVLVKSLVAPDHPEVDIPSASVVASEKGEPNVQLATEKQSGQ